MKVKKISHVAIVVKDINEARAAWKRAAGLEANQVEYVPAQKVDAALMPVGDTDIELLEPKGNEALVRFLEKRGPSVHHIAFEVEGLDEVLALLASLDVPLIDRTPRLGAHNHRTAFLHPKATGGVLIELVEPISGGGSGSADESQ